jgi:hypothetical protein
LGAFVEKHPTAQRPQAFVYDLSGMAVEFAVVWMGKPAGYDAALFEAEFEELAKSVERERKEAGKC